MDPKHCSLNQLTNYQLINSVHNKQANAGKLTGKANFNKWRILRSCLREIDLREIFANKFPLLLKLLLISLKNYKSPWNMIFEVLSMPDKICRKNTYH